MELMYKDIVSVQEVSSASSAQAYLDLGWILLGTARVEEGSNGHILYSLGWPSSKGEVVLPENLIWDKPLGGN